MALTRSLLRSGSRGGQVCAHGVTAWLTPAGRKPRRPRPCGAALLTPGRTSKPSLRPSADVFKHKSRQNSSRTLCQAALPRAVGWGFQAVCGAAQGCPRACKRSPSPSSTRGSEATCPFPGGGDKVKTTKSDKTVPRRRCQSLLKVGFPCVQPAGPKVSTCSPSPTPNEGTPRAESAVQGEELEELSTARGAPGGEDAPDAAGSSDRHSGARPVPCGGAALAALARSRALTSGEGSPRRTRVRSRLPAALSRGSGRSRRPRPPGRAPPRRPGNVFALSGRWATSASNPAAVPRKNKGVPWGWEEGSWVHGKPQIRGEATGRGVQSRSLRGTPNVVALARPAPPLPFLSPRAGAKPPEDLEPCYGRPQPSPGVAPGFGYQFQSLGSRESCQARKDPQVLPTWPCLWTDEVTGEVATST